MTEAPNAAELVAMTGRALYGTSWQSDMAQALGVQLRTVQRVAEAARNGQDYPSARAWRHDLATLIEGRTRDLAGLRALLLAD